MEDNTITLCKVLGGSRSYGLETPTSDTDYRGVFANTHPREILGLGRFDVVQKQEVDDIVYYELRKFFDLLKHGNTGALEILFADEKSFIEKHKSFGEIVLNRHHFVDTDQMYNCLRGYMHSERRLANGERTGQLGSKRKEQLDLYGFSPKNFVQLLRLCWCGTVLFDTGEFPVHVGSYNKQFRDVLYDIKVNPMNYTKDGLNSMVDSYEAVFEHAYVNRRVSLKFNDKLANEVLRDVYLPFLIGYRE